MRMLRISKSSSKVYAVSVIRYCDRHHEQEGKGDGCLLMEMVVTVELYIQQGIRYKCSRSHHITA